uniref:PDZ domain-containing protein n=1 Tax=Meloidogyne hapla TaxID=6305 RepID=A0A1I8BZI9_MELHA
MFCFFSYFNIFLFIYLLLILNHITFETEQVESISTRSTRAEGILLCGKTPIKGAYIRLFKTNSDDLKDVLSTATTTELGKYIIQGNTANYQGTEANIDPFLKIYHKCDDKEGKLKYRLHNSNKDSTPASTTTAPVKLVGIAAMSTATASTPTMTVQIPLEEFEPLGARPNDGLVITDVQEGSPASGHLLVGDTILTVNGRKISNLKNFYQVMGIAHPTAVIEIRRPRTNEELPPEVRTDPSDNLPADVRNTLVRRNGYHYSLVTIDRVPGIRLGLSIKTRDNRVCVSDVKADSMCSPHLKIFDHIVYVSGVRVTQADVAQTLLVKSMKETNRVDLVIGRPTSRSAIAAAMIALAQEDAHDPPSVRLNVDVQQVMRQQ